MRIFQLVAVGFIIAAAIFYFAENYDWVFVSVVAACLSYFLGVRFEVKARLDERERQRLMEEEEKMLSESDDLEESSPEIDSKAEEHDPV